MMLRIAKLLHDTHSTVALRPQRSYMSLHIPQGRGWVILPEFLYLTLINHTRVLRCYKGACIYENHVKAR